MDNYEELRLERARRSERVMAWRIAEEAEEALLELKNVKTYTRPRGFHQSASDIGRSEEEARRSEALRWVRDTTQRLYPYDQDLAQEFAELGPDASAGAHTVAAALASCERMLRFFMGRTPG